MLHGEIAMRKDDVAVHLMVVPGDAFARLQGKALELNRGRYGVARAELAKVVAGNGSKDEAHIR